jgi:hypothetical protein
MRLWVMVAVLFAFGLLGALTGCDGQGVTWTEVVPTVGEAFDYSSIIGDASAADAEASCTAIDSAARSRLPDASALALVKGAETEWSLTSDHSGVVSWPVAAPSPLPFRCVRLHMQ